MSPPAGGWGRGWLPSRRSACGGDGDTAAASPGALIYEVPLAVLIRDAALPVLGGGYSGYVTSVFITSQEQAGSPLLAMRLRAPTIILPLPVKHAVVALTRLPLAGGEDTPCAGAVTTTQLMQKSHG